MNKKLILFLLLIPSIAWWDTDWGYSKSLTANENIALFTGQFKLDTKTLITAGKAKHDCGDLRIIESTPIPYYLVGCNKTYSQIFFDVDYSGNEFDLYYGNPSISSTKTTSFFSFYDGFSGHTAGSDGSPIWSIKTGSFNVNYTNSSWRYVLNTSSESIATAYTPSGNFTIFIETSDSGSGKPGIIYSYINSTHYSAVYLDGTSVMIRENISSRSLGSFTVNEFNHILLEIVSSTVNVYVNGESEGTGSYYPGSVGLYALPSASSHTTYDEFIIHDSNEVTWSLGSEQNIPSLTYEFVGSENANMRTLIAHIAEGENLVKFSLETQEITGLIRGYEAYLDWAYINFNSTGYFVNSTFFKIDADSFNYTQGDYRFDLTYSKTTAQYKKWHIVQFFDDFPAIKHIIFMTANQSGTYSPGIFPWTSCTGYVNTTGNGTCSTNMHSSAGVFHFGDTDFCGIHYGDLSSLKIYEDVDMIKYDNYKNVFWQSYDGCDKFTEETNLICGVDFFNCTATQTKPAKTLFYVNDEPKSLTRIEVPSGLTCKLNQESFSDLVDSSKINKGLNDLECYGTGNLSYFNMFTSAPYEATRFFNEKPEIYQITLIGPETRGKLNICGVPIFGNLLPFKCSDSNMFLEGNFSKGYHTFYVFKTKNERSYKDPSGGHTLSTSIQRTQPIEPPLAGAKELGPPINPPTHNIISSRRIFYSYETAVEMVITAWKNI